ncbi:hypothetical protein HTZ97_00760 [Desulfuromonas acetoxidans]|uniref:hypothetical protein n=1 Tax=Desulfuromonas acetoxidans TaxID=891 RepID=UPI00058F7FC5|nr:hypothetical protein [Desulfuromonas acetoxidans]MBF0645420.1 hypothetical protein [Desulfuromonas acetoxidans]NVD24226.1 hypothetical protein [Desulfuromonas acetoxidans]NVE15001.1 hypothetical protein [Desulfuromonas acetoxidans]
MKELNDWRFFWPKINSVETARNAAGQGVAAAIFAACAAPIPCLLYLIRQGQQQHFYLIFAPTLFFGLFAFFIYKMSRTAAVSGLILYLPIVISILNRPGGGRYSGSSFFYFLALAFVLAFINSIRGTFFYHKIIKQDGVQ